MNVLLVQPALEGDRKFGRTWMQTMFRPAPVTLPTIAACTPERHHVAIADDAFEDLPYDEPWDVVGITGSTPFAPRVGEIAAEFRRRGVKTVFGGVYPTLCPEDAAKLVDIVVVGDAEDTWPRILEDVEKGEPKPLYRSIRPPMAGRPFPRRDLLKADKYILPTSFQFTRGCVHSCDFCVINLEYGREVRKTPIDAAVADVAQARKHRIRPLMFWDDNLINYRKYAKELFARIKELNVKWVGQSTILIADDPELLKLAAESGCKALFMGIESFVQDSLHETNKRFNRVRDYKEKFKRVHDHGIAIQAGIIFGFDHDDRAVFERTLDAVCEVKLDVAAPSILTPYPGTELYRKMLADGRILTHDLSKYDSDHVVFRPAQMSPDELYQGWSWFQHQMYSLRNSARRIVGNSGSKRIQIATNIQYRWFTKKRFPRGYNPAATAEAAAAK